MQRPGQNPVWDQARYMPSLNHELRTITSIPFDAVLVPTGSRRLKENRQFVRMNIIEGLVRTPTCSINHERLKKDHDMP